MANLERDIFGNPKYVQNFERNIEFGLIPDYGTFGNIGSAENAGTTLRTLWNDDSIYVFPTSGTQMTISSESANDVAAGTGARTVLISYLDEDYIEQTEIITMNGQTAVSTVATDILRVNSLIVLTAGSAGNNQGQIYLGTGTVTAGVPATKYSIMPVNINVSRTGVYTVPAGKRYSLASNIFSSVGNKETFVQFNVSLGGTGTFISTSEFTVSDTSEIFHNFVGFGHLTPKSDVRIDVRATSGTITSRINSYWVTLTL